MKIRHPLAIRSSAFLLSMWLKTWMMGVPAYEKHVNPELDLRLSDGRFIYVFWHETLVIGSGLYARLGIPVLVSHHRDGELISQVLGFMGGSTIRGSSTRGGAKALRDMMQSAGKTHVALTPDGPKGPRRKLQMGAVYLASATGLPMVPIGMCARGAWRMKSWDRLMIPRPGRPACIVTGEPTRVPADLDREGLEHYRLLGEQRLNAAQEDAEGMCRKMGW